MEHTVMVILEGLLLFVSLTLVYWLAFKALPRKLAWLRLITARIRLPAYLLVFLVSVGWVAHELMQPADAHLHHQEPFLLVLDYAVVVAACVLAIEAGNAFICDYLCATRRQLPIPHVIQTLARGLLYATVLLLLLSRVLTPHDIAGLVTGSAVVSVILGLALQETLGNLFAGIAMQWAKPYSIGHWIKLGNEEGIVEKADWRSVTIRTKRGDHVSFPHSVVAKGEIHNFSLPTKLHAREINVGVHYRHPPDKVIEILLRCATATAGFVTPPNPLVRVTDFQDSAILYILKFWITDFEKWQDIESDARRRIWYEFQRAGIQIPFPIRDVYHHPEPRPRDPTEDNFAILNSLEFFHTLTDDQLRNLAVRLRPQLFARAETICRQDDTDATFYVLKTGRVEVVARRADGPIAFRKVLAPGEFFGEFSLMMGVPRSATVTALDDAEVLVIGKEDMRQALAANAGLAEAISRVLAARRRQLDEHLAATAAAGTPANTKTESLSSEILHKIRDFFSY